MICDFCKKEYKEETGMVKMLGSEFCLHDDKLKEYRRINGLGIKNDSISIKVAQSGRSKTEQSYIDKEKKSGNVVVRGSDGILRSVGVE